MKVEKRVIRKDMDREGDTRHKGKTKTPKRRWRTSMIKGLCDQRLYCMYRLASCYLTHLRKEAKREKDDSKEKLYKGQRGNANVQASPHELSIHPGYMLETSYCFGHPIC